MLLLTTVYFLFKASFKLYHCKTTSIKKDAGVFSKLINIPLVFLTAAMLCCLIKNAMRGVWVMKDNDRYGNRKMQKSNVQLPLESNKSLQITFQIHIHIHTECTLSEDLLL